MSWVTYSVLQANIRRLETVLANTNVDKNEIKSRKSFGRNPSLLSLMVSVDVKHHIYLPGGVGGGGGDGTGGW